ncbi:MAG TPA: helix-turn-helix transcriptional regulator [Ktedonobacterales bacterium]|jgi:transcriptional regulator with XRE-family HTH domain
MTEQVSLGGMIRHERERRGWSRGELADHIGCSADSIERWERDEKLPKRWVDKRAIAAFLDKPLEELFPPAQVNRWEWVRDLRLSDPRFKQGAEPVLVYFEEHPLFQEVRQAIHSASAVGHGGVIIFGPAMVGKTRMALEALRREVSDFLLLVCSPVAFPTINPASFKQQNVALLLDDLHECLQEREVERIYDLFRRLKKVTNRLLIVATSRPINERDHVHHKYASLIEGSGLARKQLLLMQHGLEETRRFLGFSQGLVKQGIIQPFTLADFDGTPGSLFLGLERRTKEIRFPDFPSGARAVLMALALLRQAQIFPFTESRIRRVAEGVFGAPKSLWFEVRYLDHRAWVNIGQDNGGKETVLSLPSDAYVDVCLADAGLYPANKRRIQDDFPRLMEVLSQPPADSEALFRLSRAFYYDRAGDRAAWNRLGLQSAQRGLAPLKKEREPALWAEGQLALGAAYWKLGEGGDEVMEAADRALNAALEVFTRERFPYQWAAAHKALGNVHSDFLGNHQAAHLEQTIACYQLASQVHTRKDYPFDWAILQHNLGRALAKRLQGDRAENLKDAFAYFKQALTIFTQEAYPYFWAFTLNSLGESLCEAARLHTHAQQREYQEQAIQFYYASLRVRTRAAFPYDWAITQRLLGEAYLARQQNERTENLDQALAHLQAALEVLTRESYQNDWAEIQTLLGQVYAAQLAPALGGTADQGSASLELSRRAYELALEVRTRAALPTLWAKTSYYKALLHEALAHQAEAHGNTTTAGAERQTALEMLREALEICTAEDFPEEHARVLQAMERLEAPG